MLGLTAANLVALVLAVHLPVAVERAGDALLTGGALPLGIPAQHPDYLRKFFNRNLLIFFKRVDNRHDQIMYKSIPFPYPNPKDVLLVLLILKLDNRFWSNSNTLSKAKEMRLY